MSGLRSEPPISAGGGKTLRRTPQCAPERRSALAQGTVERGAPGLGAAADRPVAARPPAPLALAVVDAEAPATIIRIAGAFDRLRQHLLDRRHQAPRHRTRRAGRSRDHRRAPERRQAGAVQRLHDVDVAEAGDDALIEQRCLDRRLRPWQARASTAGVNDADSGSGPSAPMTGCSASASVGTRSIDPNRRGSLNVTTAPDARRRMT